jgi:hypothetical protein
MKSWKLRKFFGDVVYDLRNRGLLPVVAFLLIAMVAVPLIISRGGSDSGSSAQLAGATADPAPETQQAVVSYAAGVRDYRKRLDGLSAKDPFHQQFAEAAAAAGQVSGTSVTSPSTAGSTGSAGSTTISPGTGSGSVTGPGSTGGSKKKRKKNKQKGTRTYTYQTDVAVGEADAALTPFTNVTAMTALPGDTTPVVIYFGNTADNASAMFLVSNKVSQVTGPGVCVPNPEDCALLSLSPGQTADLVYSGNGKTYRVQLVRIVQRFTK